MWVLLLSHLQRQPLQAFEEKGVKSMYPWQAAALECGEQVRALWAVCFSQAGAAVEQPAHGPTLGPQSGRLC